MTINTLHDLAVYSVNVQVAQLAEDKMSKDIAVLDSEIDAHLIDMGR